MFPLLPNASLDMSVLLPTIGSLKVLADAGVRIAAECDLLARSEDDGGGAEVEDPSSDRSRHFKQSTMRQVQGWLLTTKRFERVDSQQPSEGIRKSDLLDVYALGRMYYLLGYYITAERLFRGLVEYDTEHRTPSRVAIGVLKLHAGACSEALEMFHLDISSDLWGCHATLGTAIGCSGLGELFRARAILGESVNKFAGVFSKSKELRDFWDILNLLISEKRTPMVNLGH